MTVSTSSGRSVLWTADGVSRSWSYPFKVLSASHVLLEVTDPQGAITKVTSGFTVSGVGSEGGSVTYPISPTAPLASGYKVRVVRSVPLTQPNRIGNQGGFHAQTHEDALDLLEMQIQQVSENGTPRAVAAPFDDGTIDMTLPGKAVRAGNLLEFDSNGLPVSTRGFPDIQSSVTSAEAARDVAAGHANAALGYRDQAGQSATNALASETAAASYAAIAGAMIYDFNLAGSSGDEDWNNP